MATDEEIRNYIQHELAEGRTCTIRHIKAEFQVGQGRVERIMAEIQKEKMEREGPPLSVADIELPEDLLDALRQQYVRIAQKIRSEKLADLQAALEAAEGAIKAQQDAEQEREEARRERDAANQQRAAEQALRTRAEETAHKATEAQLEQLKQTTEAKALARIYQEQLEEMKQKAEKAEQEILTLREKNRLLQIALKKRIETSENTEKKTEKKPAKTTTKKTTKKTEEK